MPPIIDRECCIACGTCVEICPGDILAMENGRPEVRYGEECCHCGACLLDCPEGAIAYRVPLPMMLPVYDQDFFKE